MKCLKKSIIAAAIGLSFSAGLMAQGSPGTSPSTPPASERPSTAPVTPPAAPTTRTSPGAIEKSPVAGISQTEYKQNKDRISTDYKSARAQCDSMQKNAKDVCLAEAKGKEKVARAELEVSYKPTDKNRRDATYAKADAEYDVAKERCDDQPGEAKDACQKQAKAQHVAAKAEGRPAGGMSDSPSGSKRPGMGGSSSTPSSGGMSDSPSSSSTPPSTAPQEKAPATGTK